MREIKRAYQSSGLITLLLSLFICAFLFSSPSLAGSLLGAREQIPSEKTPTEGRQGRSSPSSEEEYQNALLLFEKGRVDAAIYLLQQVQKKDPTNVKVLFKLGELAIAAKNWAYAIEVLSKAAKLKPEDVPIRLLLMDVYRAYQMPIQEIMTGLEIMTLDPHNKEALSKLAFLYHDQAMPKDEEEVRKLLASVDPMHYDNLQALGLLQEANGDLWEAILTYRKIYERFPDRIEDQKILARLYGETGDLYSQLHLLGEILDRAPSKAVKREFHKVALQYRKQMMVRNTLTADLLHQDSSAPLYRDIDVTSLLTYRIPYLMLNQDLEFSLRYRNSTYIARRDFSGSENVTSLLSQFGFIKRWDGSRTAARVTVGLLSTDVAGSVQALVPADPVDFPWLERRKFGGEAVVGSLDVQSLLSPRLTLVGYAKREIMDDLDAFVRLIGNHAMGIGTTYAWPDLTTVGWNFEVGSLSDQNSRRHFTFNAGRIFWGSEPVYNYAEEREGFFHSPPLSYLAASYIADHFDYNRISPLYESYKNEWQHTAKLSGEYSFDSTSQRSLSVTGEVLHTWGRVLHKKLEYKMGFQYRDLDRHNRAALEYVHVEDQTIEATQVNPTFEGRSVGSGVHLNVTWYF